ncbi:MAG: 50S ribosomal protein L3 [Gammaproteobacteria bacterium]|nr:50S ribosomal protein L3 [Gammaproteobacteria bacterium]
MAIGLIGIKLGTSRLFRDDGESVLVTVVQAKPNLVCQIKTQENDGYSAVQLAHGTQKPQRLSKALRGHFAKNKIPVARSLNEIRIDPKQEEEFTVGDKLGVSQFVTGQRVDATGISKGKGFAGSVKRWNFAMQDATHGNSISHRHLGSTGQCQWPGKVWKGKKMAGQYGNKKITSERLKVAMVDEMNDSIFIAGAIPGAPGSEIVLKPAVKQTIEERKFVTKELEALAAAASQEEVIESPEQESSESEVKDDQVQDAPVQDEQQATTAETATDPESKKDDEQQAATAEPATDPEPKKDDEQQAESNADTTKADATEKLEPAADAPAKETQTTDTDKDQKEPKDES